MAKRRVFAAIGMFDGVHSGHCCLWHQVASMAKAAEASTLAVTFSNHPLQLIAPARAPELLCTSGERERLLHLAGADRVLTLPFDEGLRRMNAADFVGMLRDKYGVTDLVMGFNNSLGSNRVNGHDGYAGLTEATGVTVHMATECNRRTADGQPLSSSAVRHALKSGDVRSAAAVLGHNYRLEGKVIHGQGIGHKLGFPTANIEPAEPRQLVPKTGVYAVDVVLPDGKRKRGMLNIGSRPTIADGDGQVTIEVHIIDYEGDLYGQSVCLEFLERLRDECRFDSLETLRQQLKADAMAAGAIKSEPVNTSIA